MKEMKGMLAERCAETRENEVTGPAVEKETDV